MKWLMLFVVLTLAFLYASVHRGEASGLQNTEPDCKMDAGSCIKTVDGLTVSVDITPKPLKAMRNLRFRTTLSNKGKPVTDASVSITLTMPGMFMGQNVIRLVHAHEGIYEGNSVIVRCPNGEKLWQASVDIRRSGRETSVNYVFEVQ
jgi:hypothetical protein